MNSIYYEQGVINLMDIGTVALYFGIQFLLMIIVTSLLVLVARKCRILTVVFFYAFLSSVFIFIVNQNYINQLEFLNDFAGSITDFLKVFTKLFSLIYDSFISVVISIASLMTDNTSPVSDIVGNMYFVISLNGLLFILCALLFRKRNKKKVERSRYSD